MDLIIVESPTKARTLSRFLGDGYNIEATMGHIKDLPKSRLGIDVEKDFAPEYIEVKGKEDSVKIIKEQAGKSKKIFLATDPDREGEAIAAHVKEVLTESKGKTKIEFERITFHEITKDAVEKALNKPGLVDENLVDAQVARRVLDRLVGYKISPLLWRKVRRGLSAGRVQSVAVRLIVEREREIEGFKQEEYWEIYCDVKRKEDEFSVQLVRVDGNKVEIKDNNHAESVTSDLEKASYKVFDIRKKEVKSNPYPPFTTSLMTQAAARNLRWSAKKTMSVAQKLYEEGLITYHRTDSTNISSLAVTKVREYIKKNYGEKYLPEKPRFYKTKAKVAQEAHEAIRPTNIELKSGEGLPLKGQFTKDAGKLYEYIWKRFVACQMEASIYDETVIEVAAKSSSEYLLRVSGRIMKFDGWRKVITKKDVNGVILPSVEKGEDLDLLKVNPEQKFTQPPARYNEASLIKTLEKLGIGRPSTYAPIITTIQIRNYVEKDEGRFTPTPVGKAVNDFLVKNFPEIFDYSFTAKMEDSLDEIAQGEVRWVGVIGNFWDSFEEKLETVGEKSERVKIETQKLGKKCPECKEGELVIRIGRFGKFISCDRFPDCKHTEKYVEKIEMKCPDCKKGDVVVKRTKKRRKFYGCSRYPKCKWASWRNPKKSASKES